MSDKKSPGRPKEISDNKLKEIALEIKHKNHEKKLTYSFLQQQTGIGRHTWKRRIGKFIEELNSPIVIPINEESLDNVYLPNINEIFERNKNDSVKIINELYNFEHMFQLLNNELTSLRKKLKSLEELPKIVEKQIKELKEIHQIADYYERKYKHIVLTSTFPHLRDEKGIKDNLLKFSTSSDNHTSLKESDINELFSDNSDINTHLSNHYPELFKNNSD